MFNTLYRCTRTIVRHQNAPLAESRRRYLEHLAAQGAAIHTIRAAAGVIYRATVLMKLDESSSVERKDVERAAKRWAHRWYRNQAGADVQHLLPALCTHLGHISLSGTQRYLTMTPELLVEAALRFANYAEEVSRGQA